MSSDPPDAAPNGPDLTPARWAQIEPLLDSLLDAGAERREGLLAELTRADPTTGEQIRALIEGEGRLDPLLDRPALERFGDLLAPPPAVPHDRYRIEEIVGQGGMAVVYRAQDLRQGRQVAIKVLADWGSPDTALARFLAEIRTMSSLRHEHIVPLLDSGEADGRPYFVMPYVEGESLRDRLERQGALPAGEALRIAAEIAEALDAAHRAGIVHRDIKPENILLRNDAALVADFGIALALDRALGPRLTAAGATLGTPRYMSPEQTAGDPVDGRSDLFSLGVVLFEMLTGTPPFDGASRLEVGRRIVSDPAPAPSARRPEVPRAADAIVRTALAKAPAERYPGARRMAEALRAAAARAATDPAS